MEKNCLFCTWFREYDQALTGEDPWDAQKHMPYRSFKGCTLRPEPVKKPSVDLSLAHRCVTNGVARLINRGTDVVIHKSLVYFPDGRILPLSLLEYHAMEDEASWCRCFEPKIRLRRPHPARLRRR